MVQLLHYNWKRVSKYLPLSYNYYTLKSCLSWYRAWDFDRKLGLIIAGSGSPRSRTVEISNDGKNFTEMERIPYGFNQMGGCLVIIDDETVFYAGGMSGKNYDNINLLI